MPRKGTGAGGRPPKPEGEKKVPLNLRVHPRTRDQLADLAEAQDLPMAQVVERLVDEAASARSAGANKR